MQTQTKPLEIANLLTPEIQFPVTICALFYGDYTNLCRRFLERLYFHTDPSLFHLRIGLNEVAPTTHNLVHSYQEDHPNILVFEEPRNVFKNPLMRRMFHETPITTRWTLWFDDDSYPFQGDWLSALAMSIQTHPEVSFWGRQLKTRASQEAVQFIRTAKWYRGRPLILEDAGDETSPQPTLYFLEGAYWAGRTQVLYDLDWPDPRLVQNEEDYLFGEALRQNAIQTGTRISGVVLNDGARRAPPETPSSYDACILTDE